jgi:hypothetical protein
VSSLLPKNTPIFFLSSFYLIIYSSFLKIDFRDVGGTEGTYTLSLTGVSAEGDIAVAVSKADYHFDPPFQMAEVFYVEPVTFTELTATDNTAGTTIQLTLIFDKPIDGLSRNDITLTGVWVGMGMLVEIGSTSTYKLVVVSIPMAGEITVEVNKSGYLITPASMKVQVHKNMGVPVNGAADMPSIKEKFGVIAPETTGVTAAFNELHAYIQKGGLSSQSPVIKLGDWIDLEAGLTVEAYHADTMGGGDFAYTGKSTYTRLIVVGINSFRSGNGLYAVTANDGVDHVVFQFQNIPVTRRMNQSDTNAGGYAQSEMRTYLTENFLDGLKDAGVPIDVLWAPVRFISQGKTGGAGTLTDKLWLPTDREMFQGRTSSADGETAANQARLEYYTDDSRRVKHSNNGQALFYWESSAFPYDLLSFCSVTNSGSGDNGAASDGGGVAPAFCVK